MENNNKNNNANSLLYFFIFYFISSFVINMFILGPMVQTTQPTEEINEIENKEIEYDFHISYNQGNGLRHIKTNDYVIENGLIKAKEINYNGEIIDVVVNTTTYSIKDMKYETPKTFSPQYSVLYYNGSFLSTYYCDNVIYNDDNSIDITTNKEKLHIYGNYKVETLTEKEIEKWKEENTTTEDQLETEKELENSKVS